MKIRLFPFAAIAVVMASCSNEDVMELNPDPAGDALSFSIAVSHSRATETKVGILGDFDVVAKGVHPAGTVYDNYLIGSATKGETATRNGSSTIWNLGRNVYWPSSMSSAIFWAYTFSQKAEDGTVSKVLPDGVTFAFDETDKTAAQIKDFTPVKADLSAAEAESWDDGKKQTDMLVAFTHQMRSVNPSSVSLDFRHVLTQINIKAQSVNKLENDSRIVKVKGAWIVNSKDKGTFRAKYTQADDVNHTVTITENWVLGSTSNDKFSAYGSFYKQPIILQNSEDKYDLLNASLMLPPQSLTGWNKTEADKEGAYILLLCRVELKHSGVAHEGATDVGDVKPLGENHYHQQFPVNAENKFDASQYGFVCVPVSTTLEAGKRYTFTLDVCGASTGVGNYPPDLYDDKFNSLIPEDKEFTTIFDGNAKVNLSVVKRTVKHVGDFVLDDPIKFSVTVNTDWSDASSDWSQGTGNL